MSEFWLFFTLITLCAILFVATEIVHWLEETDSVGEGIESWCKADKIMRKPK